LKDKFIAKRKPRNCPRCGSAKVVAILYGMPSYDLAEQEKEGKFVLGGCCVTDCDPAWQCIECGAQVYREADVFPEQADH